jgi:hypothetical protein
MAAWDSAETNAPKPRAAAIAFFFIINVLMTGSPGSLARERFILVIIYSPTPTSRVSRSA